MPKPLLEPSSKGLFCPVGEFFIDPWQPVDRAIITHAHSDHACPGSRAYLSTLEAMPLLQARLGAEAHIEGLVYGQSVRLGGVSVTFHPSGHILGSTQIRLEHRGQIWVVSGDYKLEPDPTCRPWEPVKCHTFVTESTFGLPVFRWPAQPVVIDQMRDWIGTNQRNGRTSVLLSYALGKAQRVLAGLGGLQKPVFTHGAVENFTELYRRAGVALPETRRVSDAPPDTLWEEQVVLAPPGAASTPWIRRFKSSATGFVSGWMRIRGARRRRAVDRGFTLSDHADWDGLVRAVLETGAGSIKVTHGYVEPLVRYLQERGLDAEAWPSRFEGELDVDTEERPGGRA